MQIDCKNVTDKDCNYSVNAETVEEAKKQMRDHIASLHPEITEDELSDIDMKIEEEFESDDEDDSVSM